MAFTADEVRARLLAQKNRGNDNANNGQRRARSQGDKALYPFWEAKTGGDPVVLRFLPDADPENPFFWRERQIIRLPFNGIVGGDYQTTKNVEVTVPCMNMFGGKKCPIIDYTRPWWRDDASAEQKALARTYWKKRSYIFQGFVVRSPIVEEEENIPENPIRRFPISPQLFAPIETSLLDPEMTEMPDHFDAGRDFYIRKTQQGEYSNYSTSGWSMAGPRSLSQAERDAIDTFGLFDLKVALGEEPDAERLAIIEAMFHSSLNGDPFDTAAFGDYYRAYSNDRGNGGGSENTVAPQRTTTQHQVRTPAAETAAPVTAAPALVETAAPATTSAPAAAEGAKPKRTPQEILAAIKAKAAN